jgi:hypothetical protein
VTAVVFWMLRRGVFRPLWPIWVPLILYRYWRRLPPQRRSQVLDQARRLTRFALARRNFR